MQKFSNLRKNNEFSNTYPFPISVMQDYDPMIVCVVILISQSCLSKSAQIPPTCMLTTMVRRRSSGAGRSLQQKSSTISYYIARVARVDVCRQVAEFEE